MDRILIAQPVAPLHRVVHVPPPVVLVHIPQRSIDPSLGRDSVRAGREQLRYARGVEAGLCESEGCTETSATGADDDRIVLMVLSFHCC